MAIFSRILVKQLGFSNGCVEFGPKKPPPLVPNCLMETIKNKDGEVIEIDRSNNRAKVKGINIVKKHTKSTKEKKGGIFDKENFIHISNLSIIKDSKKIKKTEIKK